MRVRKKSLFALTAGIVVAAATSALAVEPTVAGDFDAVFKLYNATLIDSLIAEGTPRAMTLAASAITYGPDDSEKNVEKQRSLLARAATMAPDDAWVQWIAAVYLPRSKIMSEPALALQRIEPDNGAAWMFRLAAAWEAKDETGITEALARIGASRDFDDHFGDTMSQWLAVVRAHPLPQLATEGSAQASEQMPVIMAVGRAGAASMVNYTSATQGCKATGQPLADDRRDACIAAGRLMLNEAKTLISMRIGAALIRLADADDVIEVTRAADYFMKEASDLSASVQFDPVEVERFQTDWEQTGSEIQAIKNRMTRAGIPLLPPSDWNEDPYGNLAKIAAQNNG